MVEEIKWCDGTIDLHSDTSQAGGMLGCNGFGELKLCEMRTGNVAVI